MYILNLTLFCFNFRKTYLAWNVTYPIVAQPTNETLEPPPFNLTIYKGKKALVEEWYSDSSPLLFTRLWQVPAVPCHIKTFGKIETANAIFWMYFGGTA